jgi:hypothetical protein
MMSWLSPKKEIMMELNGLQMRNGISGKIIDWNCFIKKNKVLNTFLVDVNISNFGFTPYTQHENKVSVAEMMNVVLDV